jgi:hypothetical protein
MAILPFGCRRAPPPTPAPSESVEVEQQVDPSIVEESRLARKPLRDPEVERVAQRLAEGDSVERNETGGLTLRVTSDQIRPAMEALLAERARESDGADLERDELDSDKAARAAQAGSFPQSEWAVLGREGGCSELSALSNGLPELEQAPDPFRLVALLRGRGIEASTELIPGANEEAVIVKIPSREIGLVFLQRSRCTSFDR